MNDEVIFKPCPYCGTITTTCRPKHIPRDERAHQKKGFRPFRSSGDKLEPVPMPDPYETKFMPYTRDVDKFDPLPGDENPNQNPDYWSRIGEDFLGFIDFERIGILRKTTKYLDVRYRVCRCENPQCARLFDVFLNYSKDEHGTPIEFKDLWPHLFTPVAKNSKEIKEYNGVSIILYSLHGFGKKLKSNNLAITIFCLILLLLPLFPWLLNPADRANSHYILTSLSNINGPESSALLDLAIQNFLLYFVAVLAVGFLLILEDRYLSYMEKTRDFYNLLDVKQKETGVTFWRNYILCRIVGVQDQDKKPEFNQADVFAGGLSILMMLVIWILSNSKPGEWIPLAFVLFFLGCVIVWGLFSNRPRLSRFLIIETPLLFAILLLAAYFSYWQSPQVFWDGITASFNLLFWVIVAYFYGIGAFLGLNTALYVIKGLTRIPMKLTLFNGLAQSLPLRKLQIFSSEMLLVLFLSTIIIVAGIVFFPYLFSISPGYQWLMDWLRWGLALLFAVLGFGVGSRWYFFLAGFYCALSLLVDRFALMNETNLAISYINIVLLGVFFTLLITYQIFSIDGLVNQLFKQVKEKELGEIDAKIIAMREILRNQEKNSSINREIQDTLQVIQDYMLLRDKLDQMKVNQLLWRRMVELLSPLVVSFIFPLLGLLKP